MSIIILDPVENFTSVESDESDLEDISESGSDSELDDNDNVSIDEALDSPALSQFGIIYYANKNI